MEVVGEEGIAIDEMTIYLKAELYDFSYLQQNSFDKEDAYCPLERQFPLFKLINRIFDMKLHFQSHDDARKYFLHLQNQIKNMNFLAFNSDPYKAAYASVEKLLDKGEAE